MKAVERKWGYHGAWHIVSDRFDENGMAKAFLACQGEDSDFPLSIRYSNGQLCTFRPKRKPTK